MIDPTYDVTIAMISSSVRQGCHWGSVQIRTVPSLLSLARVLPSGEYTTEFTPSECPSNVPLCSPVMTFHNRTALSQPPLASVVPSGEYATHLTIDVCPRSVSLCLPVTEIHNLISFQPPLARVRPSGEKATVLTSDVCPSRVCKSSPVKAFHKRTVLSCFVPTSAGEGAAIRGEGDSINV